MIALPRAWRALVSGELVRTGALSTADQAMLSATNLVIGLALARFTTPDTYGAYALAIAVMLVLSGVQAAVVTTPLTILGAPREGDDLRRWVSTLLAAQIALALALGGLLAAVAVIARHASPESSLPGVLLCVTVAFFFVQTQEFCRRVLYLRLLAGRVLLNDLVYCSLQIAGIATLWVLDRRPGASGVWLSGSNVFLATAVSALAGTAVGLWQTRGFLTAERHGGAGALLREAWGMGRFNLAGQAGHVLLQFASRFVAAAYGGTVGVAMLEAPRLLVAPLHVIGIGAGSVSAPKAAIAHARGGTKALMAFLTPVAALWAAAFLGYALLIAAAPGFWLRLLYGNAYAGTESILVVWCFCYALLGLRVLPATALRVTRHYSAIMWASLAAGVVVIAASAILCSRLGVAGAALGRLAGEVVLMTLLVAAFVRQVRPWARRP